MINLSGHFPQIFGFSIEDSNICPRCLNNHLWIVNEFTKDFILNFAIKLICEMLDEEEHKFSEFDQIRVSEYLVLIADQ